MKDKIKATTYEKKERSTERRTGFPIRGAASRVNEKIRDKEWNRTRERRIGEDEDKGRNSWRGRRVGEDCDHGEEGIRRSSLWPSDEWGRNAYHQQTLRESPALQCLLIVGDNFSLLERLRD